MIDYLWKKLTSIRLAIYLFIIIAGLSIIGTVLVQNRPPQEYMRLFGVVGYRLMEFFGLFDVYHSFWFRFLLILFAINLILCSIERIPALLRYLKTSTFITAKSRFSTLPIKMEIKYSEETLNQIKEHLKKSGFRIREKKEENIVAIEGRKGTLSRWGPYITHIGIVVILAGAYIGSLFGFRASVNIQEGESTNMVYHQKKKVPIPLGFKVKCVDFSIVYYPGTKVPKDYYSDLEVYEDGKLQVKKRIEVNSPLVYKGLRFYQASYGIASVKEATFLVRMDGDEVEVTLKPHEEKKIKENLTLVLEGFMENFRGFGPTAIVRLIQDGNSRRIPVFRDIEDPGFHPSIKGGSLKLKDAKFIYYTGLEVTKDPGTNIVWIGCIIAILGMLIAFYLPHKRVFVTAFPEEGVILMGGVRKHGADYSYIEKIYNKVKGGKDA